MALTATITAGLTFSNPLTIAKLNQVWENGSVTIGGQVDSSQIGAEAVTAEKLAEEVAGGGLAGGNGVALAVQVDDATIELDDDDKLHIVNGAIGADQLAEEFQIENTNQAYETEATGVTGTHSITADMGNLIKLTLSGDTELAFDNTDFESNGVSRVAIDIDGNEHELTFDATTIGDDTLIDLSATGVTPTFWRRSSGEKWRGRQ